MTRLLFLLFIVVSCDQQPDVADISIQKEGYIVGFMNCGKIIDEEKNTGYPVTNGYYIITSDLEDTLLTYNLPKHLFEFPADYFRHMGRSFPESARYEYKIKIVYTIATGKELFYPLCTTEKPQSEFNNAYQVIIKSIEK